MARSLIIGSGPAAAGVALALSKHPDQEIIVVDLGGELEAENAEIVATLSRLSRAAWPEDKVKLIGTQPVPHIVAALPEKRSYGSDYPFRDFGQLAGVSSESGANPSVVSGAYGGFSNVWGAQVTPFTAGTFNRHWPLAAKDIEGHYQAVAAHLAVAAEDDDLTEYFGMPPAAQPLPSLAPRTQIVLGQYEANRDKLRAKGVTIGRARLAFDAGSCVRCGLCMTGCPYRLIYSASQTFDTLRRNRRVTYHSGWLVEHVGQGHDLAWADARRADGKRMRFEADRVFVCAGAVGTTRLVGGSLNLYDREIQMSESAQFVVPALSRRPTPDPRRRGEFTLNQFNMVVDLGGEDIAMTHFYPYNPAFLDALPAVLRRLSVLRRVTVGLGYLPSWASPQLRVRLSPRVGLPELVLRREDPFSVPMLKTVLRKMVVAGASLDLWPILPRIYLSAGAKSNHVGGSFPHRFSPRTHHDGSSHGTDRLGRLPAWDRVHLADASVFPAIAGTTFTFTIMANAHRIATETIQQGANLTADSALFPTRRP